MTSYQLDAFFVEKLEHKNKKNFLMKKYLIILKWKNCFRDFFQKN